MTQYVYENVGFCNKEEEKIQPHAPCCRWPTRRADECNHFQMVTFGRPMERLAEGLQMSLFEPTSHAHPGPSRPDAEKPYHGPLKPKAQANIDARKMGEADGKKLVEKIAENIALRDVHVREYKKLPTASPIYSMAVGGYEPLARILHDAYMQSAAGKGLERHADGNTFAEQPILRIGRKYGTGFNIGQAAKKIEEAQGMIERQQFTAARHEFLGAIVYLASAILLLEESTK